MCQLVLAANVFHVLHVLHVLNVAESLARASSTLSSTGGMLSRSATAPTLSGATVSRLIFSNQDASLTSQLDSIVD